MTSTLFNSSTRASTFLRRSLAGAALLAALAAPSAKAILMTPAYETQLESWLGQGDLSFTSIYNASGAGMSNAGFHAAADGKGSTITLLSVGPYSEFWNTPNQIIGGYNPQSWASMSGYSYNLTLPESERTAFIFNLSFDVMLTQNTVPNEYGDTGIYQTANVASQGPIFGGGNDLAANLNGTFSVGGAYRYSYGGTAFDKPITRGATDTNPYLDTFRIFEIDVYTFAPAVQTGGGGHAVPDAGGTFGLLGVALFGLAGLRRLKADGLARV